MTSVRRWLARWLVGAERKALDGLALFLDLLSTFLTFRSRLTSLHAEIVTMPVNPAVQAKLDEVKAAIVAEGDQIKAKVDQIIAAVQAGTDPTEIIAQLNDIAAAIDAMSDAIAPPAPPTPPVP